MAKRLFLLLISGFIGIISAPEILMASDGFDLIGLDSSGIVETVPIAVEDEPEEEQEEEDDAQTSYYTSYNTVAYEEPEPVYVAPSDSIAIAGKTLEIVDVSDTTVDSGGHVNKYGDRFLYGHNTANVFGGLTSLGVGSRFSVTYDGDTTYYEVNKVVIYEKNRDTGKLQLNGSGSYMRSVANAKYDGTQYDLSIMTCYGTSYGNGDASHRLVIFADAI